MVAIMVLMVHNTLGKRLERFVPLRKKEVRMYVCGPTVYDYVHIGNARAFVVADVVRRYLEYKGFKVMLVCNVTDIDDKTINRANDSRLSVQQLGDCFTEAYLKDMASLNIKKADVNPRATKHIPEIIDMIETLVKNEYAYEVEGDVYFDVTKIKEYGKLSGNKAEALQAGARIEVDPKKRSPADFAVWKAWKKDEPGWYSPWGKGRPGWHIECSTMATRYLGKTFDIHMGGKDLIFPHHENEVAQSEAANGKLFARFWLHNEWLTVDGNKMSKSLGNFVTVREAAKMCEPRILRFFLISAHYRSPVDFNEEALTIAETNLERLLNALGRFEGLQEKRIRESEEEKLLSDVRGAKAKFDEAMDDDFNTPLAISVLFNLAKSLYGYIESNSEIEADLKKETSGIFRELLDVLGVETSSAELETEQVKLADDLVQLVVSLRKELKDRKEWDIADKVRRGLQDIGIELEDTPEGTRWKRKRKG